MRNCILCFVMIVKCPFALGAEDREIATDKESGNNLDRPGC